jgi:putative hemolysin
MDLTAILELVLIGVLIVINAFFSASEIAIVTARRSRVRQLIEEGKHPSAVTLLQLSENPSRFLATIQVGVTIAGFFASAIGAVTVVGLMENALHQVPVGFISQGSSLISLILVTVLIAFFTLIFGELVPKNLAIRRAEAVALFVARPIDLVARALSPFVAILVGTTNLILRLLRSEQRAKMPAVTEEEIRSMIEAGEQEGVVEPIEVRMIEGVFDFGETRVHEIMVPRIDVAALPQEASVKEALDLFQSTGYSRLPVYDESIDNIVGILYAKDFLRFFGQDAGTQAITPILRPATFVPESKRVSELFTQLQHSHTHVAIVVDEYGGTAGLVTLEDMLEEIVGEIQDEYDAADKRIETVSAEEAVVSGTLSLNDLEDALDIELERNEFDTVGGLVYSKLGRIPNPGDEIVFPQVTLRVLTVHGRRIGKVAVVKHPESTAG